MHVVEQFRDCFITRDDVAQYERSASTACAFRLGGGAAETEDEAAPFIRGRGLEYIDDAVRWAKEFNLTVMLDLHGAVGSQNGKQTSGLEDDQWRAAHFDAERTIGYLAKVAERYAHEPHVIAIELVNEPELPTGALLDFYRRASDAIRAHMPPERVAVVVNLYRSWEIMTQGWASFNWHMPSSRYPNLIYDLHLYYAFHDSLDLHLNDLTGWLFIGVQTMLMSLAGAGVCRRVVDGAAMVWQHPRAARRPHAGGRARAAPRLRRAPDRRDDEHAPARRLLVVLEAAL